MPDLDASWQAVRGLMPTFQSSARSYGATRVRLYAQALTIMTVGGQSGICYGLAAEWILAQRLGRTSAISSAFRIAGHAASHDGERNDDWWRISHTLHHQQFNRHEPLEALQATESDQFHRAGLTLVTTGEFHHSYGRMARAADFMIAQNGYYVINTPNHAMAARTTGGACTFFDPNLGEAEFPDQQSFRGFVVHWLSKKRITRSYAGRRGGALDPGRRHKTLHLSIDRYT